jgi:alpha-methylacyl-CoA racemase
MTDGSALLMSMMWGFRAQGIWGDARGTNLLDTGAPFYDTYETADGKFVAIGSIEGQFYALLREALGLAADPLFDNQYDRAQWPAQKARLAEIFRTKTRDEWCASMEASDICFAPVLDWDEVADHPHNKARGTFVEVNGVKQPAPAPRYSATPCDPPR